MESYSLQNPSPLSSSSPPLEKPVESFIGSFVTLISNSDIRYEGIIYQINLQNSTLALQNVVCHGTEKMNREEPQIRKEENNNGSKFPFFKEVHTHMTFNGSDIKELIVSSERNKSIDYIIGHFLSVITKEGVRVEGILTHLNVHEKLLIMKNAHCYGSEGRKRKKRLQIQPCNKIAHPVHFMFKEIYDHEIIFIPKPEVEDDQSMLPLLAKSHVQHRRGRVCC